MSDDGVDLEKIVEEIEKIICASSAKLTQQDGCC